MTATLEELNDKQTKDFESLKQEADRIKAQYEKEGKTAADMAQSLQSQLSDSQQNNAKMIATLQEDIKAKEHEMSQLQSTAAERSRTIASMKTKLEAYQQESERAIENNKNKIAKMTEEYERQIAQGKAAHKAELLQLEKKLQNDIQRLQQDLHTRSTTITDLKKKLDSSMVSNKKLSGEIVGLNTARRSTESLLKDSSNKLEGAMRDVERLKQEIQGVKKSDASNISRIRGLENELAEKSTTLERTQARTDQFASEKDRLLADLTNLKSWKDSAQLTINSLSNEIALNSLSNEIANSQGGSLDAIINKLSGIRNELSKKDAQLSATKSATEALLKEKAADQKPGSNTVEKRSFTPGGQSTLGRKAPVQSTNVIGGGFASRNKNVATVRENRLASSPSQQDGRPREEVTVEASSNDPAPMSGWAGYKNPQWGGYLDSL